MCVCMYAPDVCTCIYMHTDTVCQVLEIGSHQELPEKRGQTWRFGALSEGDCSVRSLQKSSSQHVDWKLYFLWIHSKTKINEKH